MAVILVVQAVSALWLVVGVIRRTGIDLHPHRSELRTSLTFGLKTYSQSLTSILHERLDIILLAALLNDSRAVAYYGVAVTVAGVIRLVTEVTGISAYPHLTTLGDDAAGRFTARLMRTTVVVVVTLSAGVALVSPVVVPAVFGPAYEASIPPLMLLLPAVCALSVYRVLGRYFISRDIHRIGITTQIASVAANVVLNLVLIPRYGIEGAAFASFVSYSIAAVLISRAFRRTSGMRFSETFVPRRDDLTDLARRLRRLAERGEPIATLEPSDPVDPAPADFGRERPAGRP
jgi:O-antigen/teichoic acid export membrane protein